MSAYDNVNGVLRSVSKIYNNIGGALMEVKTGYDNVNGTLRRYHPQMAELLYSIAMPYEVCGISRIGNTPYVVCGERNTDGKDAYSAYHIYKISGNSYTLVRSISKPSGWDYIFIYGIRHYYTISGEECIWMLYQSRRWVSWTNYSYETYMACLFSDGVFITKSIPNYENGGSGGRHTSLMVTMEDMRFTHQHNSSNMYYAIISNRSSDVGEYVSNIYVNFTLTKSEISFTEITSMPAYTEIFPDFYNNLTYRDGCFSAMLGKNRDGESNKLRIFTPSAIELNAGLTGYSDNGVIHPTGAINGKFIKFLKKDDGYFLAMKSIPTSFSSLPFTSSDIHDITSNAIAAPDNLIWNGANYYACGVYDSNGVRGLRGILKSPDLLTWIPWYEIGSTPRYGDDVGIGYGFGAYGSNIFSIVSF